MFVGVEIPDSEKLKLKLGKRDFVTNKEPVIDT